MTAFTKKLFAKLRARLPLRASQSGPDWTQLAPATRAQLEVELPKLEQSFLAISNQLEPVANQSQNLVGKCEDMLRLAAGIDSGNDIVHRTLGLLQGPLTYIDHCVQQRERLLQLLTDAEKQIATTISVRADMQAALAPLTYISVLFKIESARLPIEMREAFITVTAEIEQMRSLVDESISRNTELLQSAQGTLREARQKLEREFTRVAHDVAQRRAQIEGAMATLDSQMKHNAARDLRLTRHSQEVSAEVSRIVQNLQFQDIVHQKCIHVVDALGDTRDTRGLNAALQAGQLDAVVTDLAEGEAKIASGLQSLAKKASDLENASSSLDDLQGMTAAADGIVQLLLDTVANVRTITQEVADLTHRTHRAMDPLNGLAEKLTSALSDVAVNMNIIALNAQIRSVVNGSGTGLEQLSARTAQISTEVSTLSGTNTENLGRLGHAMREMLSKFEELGTRGVSTLATFDAARGAAEKDLHEIRDQTLNAFQTIGSTIADLRREVSLAETAVAQLAPTREAIAAQAVALHTFQLDPPMTAAEARLLAAQASRYTMASEKAVLAKLLGTSSNDVVDCEVEMFGGAAPAPAPKVTPTAGAEKNLAPAAPVAAAAATAAAVDLFDDFSTPPAPAASRPTAPAAPATPPAAAAVGAPPAALPLPAAIAGAGNIELF